MSGLREFSGEAISRRSGEVVAELLRRLARERPLLVVLEDLQWADEPTLELIESLFALDRERAGGAGDALPHRSRGAARGGSGERARQRYPHRYRELELRPLLDDSAGERLVEALADGPVPDGVAALLVERAGGNPLFLAEALRDQIERGTLRRGTDGWWGRRTPPMEVPALVQGVLQARLDRLDPAAREVVAVAAVIGRRFGMPLLERLVDPATLRLGAVAAAAAGADRRGAAAAVPGLPVPARTGAGGGLRHHHRRPPKASCTAASEPALEELTEARARARARWHTWPATSARPTTPSGRPST